MSSMTLSFLCLVSLHRHAQIKARRVIRIEEVSHSSLHSIPSEIPIVDQSWVALPNTDQVTWFDVSFIALKSTQILLLFGDCIGCFYSANMNDCFKILIRQQYIYYWMSDDVERFTWHSSNSSMLQPRRFVSDTKLICTWQRSLWAKFYCWIIIKWVIHLKRPEWLCRFSIR